MGSMDRGVMGVHSNDGSWADSGVVADHVGGVGHALADLVALGGDDLLAVLYRGHVNVLRTYSPPYSPVIMMIGNDSDNDNDNCVPGSVCRDLLALFDRDGVTDGL